jgi:hypothetical protein
LPVWFVIVVPASEGVVGVGEESFESRPFNVAVAVQDVGA